MGYSVSNLDVSPSNSHIASIQRYPVPKNASEVISCLGLFSYFRRFVPAFCKNCKIRTVRRKCLLQ